MSTQHCLIVLHVFSLHLLSLCNFYHLYLFYWHYWAFLAFEKSVEGGKGGGEVVAKGTPEEFAKNKKNYTAQFLKKELL